jgi:hypothetical protein
MAKIVQFLNQNVCHIVRRMHCVSLEIVASSQTQKIHYVFVLCIVLASSAICATTSVAVSLVLTMELVTSQPIQAVNDLSFAVARTIFTGHIVSSRSLLFVSV